MSGRRTKALRRSMPRYPLMPWRDASGAFHVVPGGFRQFKRGTLYDPAERERLKRIGRERETRARENEPRILAGQQHSMRTSFGKDKRAGRYAQWQSARRAVA